MFTYSTTMPNVTGNLKSKMLSLQNNAAGVDYSLSVSADDEFELKRGDVCLLSVAPDGEAILDNSSQAPPKLEVLRNTDFQGNVTVKGDLNLEGKVTGDLADQVAKLNMRVFDTDMDVEYDFPEDGSVVPLKRDLTVKHLAEYRAGIDYAIWNWGRLGSRRNAPWYGARQRFVGDFALKHMTENPLDTTRACAPFTGVTGLTTTDYIRNYAKYPLAASPGFKVKYSPCYDILGAAIGVAAKNKGICGNGAEYLKLRIFDPCGSNFYVSGDNAAPADVSSRLAELVVNRTGGVPYEPYDVPMDPNADYSDGRNVWASDAPLDGTVAADGGYLITTAPTADEQPLNGITSSGGAGTLDDYAKILKMILNKGMVGNTRVMSEGALRYALTPYLQGADVWSFDDDTLDDSVTFSGAYNLASGKVNWTGGVYCEDNIFDRLEDGVCRGGGYFGSDYAFDMGTGDYVVCAMTQCATNNVQASTRIRQNDRDIVHMTEAELQALVDQVVADGWPGYVILRGNVRDNTEYYIQAGKMRKDQVGDVPRDTIYRFASMTKNIGRLELAIAVIDDRIIKSSTKIGSLIPEFATENLTVHNPRNFV